ncbi:metalloregulator ArsR/SmtB family transcription factor [Paenibacillus sp. FSL W8-0194]|uniref:ArsR/SmtB family transcription factor n=1 Tax=Paenibacillus sp. FSL W8-0194 TaxID=2921711 RepID=UPI0030DABF8F
MPKTVSDEAGGIAQILKLLGDPTRLTIIKLLQYRECCVCELVEFFEVSQPAISQHLRKLKDAGLLKERKAGQWVHYAWNPQSRHHALVADIMAHVPAQDQEFKALEDQGITPNCC